MTPAALVRILADRGVRLTPEGNGLVATPASKLTDADRQAIRAHKAELLTFLLVERIEATWRPGERFAFRDGGQLLTAKYAGTTTSGRVNVWCADGDIRAIPPESVALDWHPDAAEIFEDRLSIMLEAGVPEEQARARAEQSTRAYLDRLAAA